MKENVASKQKNTGLRYLYACIMGISSVAICISCAITPFLLSSNKEEKEINTTEENNQHDEIVAEVNDKPEEEAEEATTEPEQPAENYYAPAPAKEETSVTYETVVIYDQPVEDSTPVVDERAFDSDDPYEE